MTNFETDDHRPVSPAVARAARVLQEIASAPRSPIGASELSRRLGIPKSTLLNICTELVAAQLLRPANGGYLLGRRLAELGRAYLNGVQEVEEFYLVARELMGQGQQTVQLAALGDGSNVLYLARHDGTDPLHLGSASEIGRSVPAHCTAAGKALLAALPDDEVVARLEASQPLPVLTQHSASTVDQVLAEVERTRAAGYSSEREEVVPGLACIGIAIDSPHREDGLLAVSFTFRAHRLSIERIVDEIERLKDFGRELGRRIGSERGEVA